MSDTPFRFLSPEGICPPLGNYSPGVLVPAGINWLFTSGQLGVSKDGAIPTDVEAQAELCFFNLAAILEGAGMTFANVVRLNAWVTRREDFQVYMRVRDRYVANPPPASTLMIVSGFTRPEMLVEVEVIAALSVSRRSRPGVPQPRAGAAKG